MNDTAVLLEEIEAYWRRFLIASDEQIIGLTIWALHTYVYEAFNTTPYLIVTSAEMRSGKSTVLEVLDVIACNAFYTTGATEAVLFRIIESDKPTLLLDEQDRALKETHGQLSEKQEMIVAIINLGYRKKGKIPRVGLTREIEKFSVYCPKALAGIGRMPQTIEDRGLPMRMVRMSNHVHLEEFDEDINGDDGYAIGEKCMAWAGGARLLLSGQRPDMPSDLDRRAKQAYRVLVAVGDMAGEPWSTRIRDALVRLRTSASESPKESHGIKLLRDVAEFIGDLDGKLRVETRDLLAMLYEHGDQPWSEWWKGKDGDSYGKTAGRRLANLLGEYGLSPYKWKENGECCRGYEVAPLVEVVHLYGIDTPPHATLAQAQGLRDTSTRHPNPSGGVLANGANPHEQREVASGGVTDPKGSVKWLGQASMDELREFYESPETGMVDDG